MKKLVVLTGLILILSASAMAIPPLQIYISGATYNDISETWVTTSSSFDMYIIGSMPFTDVMVSIALDNPMNIDPNGTASVDVDGATYNSWTYGYTPLATAAQWDGGADLAPHGIYPAWFTEFNAGDFGLVSGIGDIQPGPEFWDPVLDGYYGTSNPNLLGEIRSFHVEVNGATGAHFDAYTTNGTSIEYFAPFSHDSEFLVPEPGTVFLVGIGLMGFGLYRRFRK
jgi:hypothetical protein